MVAVMVTSVLMITGSGVTNAFEVTGGVVSIFTVTVPEFERGGTAPFVAHSNSGYLGLTLRPARRLRFDQTYYYTRLGSPVDPLPLQSTGCRC